ncbi:hypothetical protein OIB37_01440 [Streptomyces sp. NBC_00820]|uniref:hypothetical protein n=1 Tax=Streptomyces sp. NBC_00820 TaxID=2975842 RepID=UPI002ED40221|nr:hypothetical protein OIB37_01440 [Streptomyces sp. NBC_00820]
MKQQPPQHTEPLGPVLSRWDIGRLLAETATGNLARTGWRPYRPDTTAPRSR